MWLVMTGSISVIAAVGGERDEPSLRDGSDAETDPPASGLIGNGNNSKVNIQIGINTN